MSRTCFARGYLVAADDWLPDAPCEYFDEAVGLFVGCNALACGACGQRVRHALGHDRLPDVAPRALHAAPDWRAVAPPTPGATGRLYACACAATVARYTASVIPPEDEPDRATRTWGCAGHPALALPGELAELPLPREPDWATLVAQRLTATATPPTHPRVDPHPGFLLVRLHVALGDGPAADALGRAVAARARSTERAERAAAALFFAQRPMAAGLDEVIAAFREDPRRFDGPAPWGPEPTLRGVLLGAIAFRSLRRRSRGASDPTAQAALRWAATTPPGLGPTVFQLPDLDGEWAAEHVDQLIAADPHEWMQVLEAIRLEDQDRLLAAARAAVLGGAARDELLETVERLYGEDALRAVTAALRP